MELVKVSKNTLEEYYEYHKDNKNIGNSVLCGSIKEIKTRDCASKEGNKFTMVDLIVETPKGKSYRRSYNVDFMKRYLTQLQKNIRDIYGACVYFTIKKPYNEISWLAFLTTEEDFEEIDVHKIDITSFKNEEEPVNMEDIFKKLGF